LQLGVGLLLPYEVIAYEDGDFSIVHPANTVEMLGAFKDDTSGRVSLSPKLV
jgi:hypothetical protein